MLRPFDPGEDADAVERLLGSCRDAGDDDPLSEAKRISIRGGGHGAGVVQLDDHRLIGFGQVLAYAGHVHDAGAADHRHPEARWEAEFVVDPRHRSRSAVPLLEATIAAAPPGAIVEVWAAEDYQMATLQALGWVPFRALHRLEARPVPRVGAVPPPGISIEPFVVGRDEGAFLVANHAAFADHPEQSSWDLGALAARLAQPWFDPAGFLVARRGSPIVGFCWTKVRPDDATMGEIFLIGVVPEAQGTGLGSSLIGAGLAHLDGARGVGAAMLYSGDANHVALAMYGRMGFEIVATKRVFRAPVTR